MIIVSKNQHNLNVVWKYETKTTLSISSVKLKKELNFLSDTSDTTNNENII